MPIIPSPTIDARRDFEALETVRAQTGVSKAQLCRRADLNQSTYVLLLQRRERTPHRRTVSRLRAALGELIDGFAREAAE